MVHFDSWIFRCRTTRFCVKKLDDYDCCIIIRLQIKPCKTGGLSTICGVTVSLCMILTDYLHPLIYEKVSFCGSRVKYKKVGFTSIDWGNFAERLERWTCNPEAKNLICTLIASWICWRLVKKTTSLLQASLNSHPFYINLTDLSVSVIFSALFVTIALYKDCRG